MLIYLLAASLVCLSWSQSTGRPEIGTEGPQPEPRTGGPVEVMTPMAGGMTPMEPINRQDNDTDHHHHHGGGEGGEGGEEPPFFPGGGGFSGSWCGNVWCPSYYYCNSYPGSCYWAWVGYWYWYCPGYTYYCSSYPFGKK